MDLLTNNQAFLLNGETNFMFQQSGLKTLKQVYWFKKIKQINKSCINWLSKCDLYLNNTKINISDCKLYTIKQKPQRVAKIYSNITCFVYKIGHKYIQTL